MIGSRAAGVWGPSYWRHDFGCILVGLKSRANKRGGGPSGAPPGPPSQLGTVGSVQRHFRHEQVIAARAVHVRVEDDDLAVGTRLGEGVGIIVGMRRVVMDQQPRVAAVAAYDADGFLP